MVTEDAVAGAEPAADNEANERKVKRLPKSDRSNILLWRNVRSKRVSDLISSLFVIAVAVQMCLALIRGIRIRA